MLAVCCRGEHIQSGLRRPQGPPAFRFIRFGSIGQDVEADDPMPVAKAVSSATSLTIALAPGCIDGYCDKDSRGQGIQQYRLAHPKRDKGDCALRWATGDEPHTMTPAHGTLCSTWSLTIVHSPLIRGQSHGQPNSAFTEERTYIRLAASNGGVRQSNSRRT